MYHSQIYSMCYCNIILQYTNSQLNSQQQELQYITMTANITELLYAIQSSTHWQQQIAYLSQIPISQNTAKLLNNTKYAIMIKSLLENPRSKVITTTCQFMIEVVQKYGPLLHNFTSNLIGTDIVFRLLNSSNKIIWTSVNQLIKTIVIHCGNVKFYTVFGEQMGTKNGQVREFISFYLLVLADMIQMPSNYETFIKNWKNDAKSTVRVNAQQLQQILLNQNAHRKNLISKQNCTTQPQKRQKKQTNKQINNKKLPLAQNSQIIMQSFIKQENQSVELQLDEQSNIDFLISKIHSDETWNLKVFAIQELCSIFQSFLQKGDERFFDKILAVILQLLDLKKSKVYIAMGNMVKKAIQNNPELFSKFIQKNFSIFVQKAGKNQEFGIQLISATVNLELQKYIIQLAQSTIDVKSIKQKSMLLDILVEKVCAHILPVSKISTLLKLICRHIEKYSSNKQIYLPCLAIFSQIKEAYPHEFLSCLLCQQKDILTKIIKIAQTVDPHLRQVIVSYIHSLKGTKNQRFQKKQQKNQHFSIRNQQFRNLINEVSNNEENAVTKLVEYVFQSKQAVAIRQFYQIIKLTQKVVQKNSLVQLELLLEQICKSHNQKFLQALFQAISSCDGSTIESEYILAYLRKVNTIFRSCSWLMNPHYAEKLITIYRYSKCPKTRLMCIKTLSLFPDELIQTYVSTKQKKLIHFQQKSTN